MVRKKRKDAKVKKVPSKVISLPTTSKPIHHHIWLVVGISIGILAILFLVMFGSREALFGKGIATGTVASVDYLVLNCPDDGVVGIPFECTLTLTANVPDGFGVQYDTLSGVVIETGVVGTLTKDAGTVNGREVGLVYETTGAGLDGANSPIEIQTLTYTPASLPLDFELSNVVLSGDLGGGIIDICDQDNSGSSDCGLSVTVGDGPNCADSTDANTNGVPDVCEDSTACIVDVNVDNVMDEPYCATFDYDGDGVTNGYEISAGTDPFASCSDGYKNQDETDSDCGGSCGATCDEGKLCASTGDNCASGLTCTGESSNWVCRGVGGAALGSACSVPGDCASGYCDATNFCATPTCFDGVQNQGESGIDCGGSSTCLFCDGDACAGDNACVSGNCDISTTSCVPALLADGEVCALPTECASGYCGAGGVCEVDSGGIGTANGVQGDGLTYLGVHESDTPSCGDGAVQSYENCGTCLEDYEATGRDGECSGTDADGDAVPDHLESAECVGNDDCDGDGVLDGADYCPGTDAASPNYVGFTDEMGFISLTGCPVGDVAGDSGANPDGCFDAADTAFIYPLYDQGCTTGPYGPNLAIGDDNDGVDSDVDYCPGTDQASANYVGFTYEMGFISANGCPVGDIAGNVEMVDFDGANIEMPRPDGCFNSEDTAFIYPLFDQNCGGLVD